MNIFKTLLENQLGKNWKDRSPRGLGNRAARRAIATKRGREHIRSVAEETYTDRPWILKRGQSLLLVDEYPHMRNRINPA